MPNNTMTTTKPRLPKGIKVTPDGLLEIPGKTAPMIPMGTIRTPEQLAELLSTHDLNQQIKKGLYLSPAQVAYVADMSHQAVREAIERGVLPAIKVGPARWVHVGWFNHWQVTRQGRKDVA